MRVERELRAMLASMERGQQLPNVGELAARWSVGHGTVTRTLRKLAAEDPPLVTIIPRYGVFRA